MIASLALALLAAAPTSSQPVFPVRPIDDEEIIWATSSRDYFWLRVVQRASGDPAVLERLERRGLPSLCRELDEQRGRLVARFSGPFSDMVVAKVRENVEPGRLVEAVDHADGHSSHWLPQTELQAWKEQAAAATAAFVWAAAGDLVSRLSRLNGEESRYPPDGARLKPEALARVRRDPDAIAFWCHLSETVREKAVGGYLEGGD